MLPYSTKKDCPATFQHKTSPTCTTNKPRSKSLSIFCPLFINWNFNFLPIQKLSKIYRPTLILVLIIDNTLAQKKPRIYLLRTRTFFQGNDKYLESFLALRMCLLVKTCRLCFYYRMLWAKTAFLLSLSLHFLGVFLILWSSPSITIIISSELLRP